MEITSSNVLAALALVVSLAALWNSYLARLHAHSNALDEMRRASLAKVQELELGWQAVLNDLYHFTQRVKKDVDAHSPKESVLDWVSQVRPTFEASHQHIVKMRRDLEGGFDDVTLNEARHYLREFDGMNASLNATRTEMARRLDLLFQNAL